MIIFRTCNSIPAARSTGVSPKCGARGCIRRSKAGVSGGRRASSGVGYATYVLDGSCREWTADQCGAGSRDARRIRGTGARRVWRHVECAAQERRARQTAQGCAGRNGKASLTMACMFSRYDLLRVFPDSMHRCPEAGRLGSFPADMILPVQPEPHAAPDRGQLALPSRVCWPPRLQTG